MHGFSTQMVHGIILAEQEAMLANTVTPDGYTVRTDGTWNPEIAKLVNTWFQDANRKWYCFSENGLMYRNTWHQHTDGKWYYFNEDGIMLAGCLANS